MMQIVVTMAGFGRRFLDSGYDVPKYRIVAHRRSLFAWSMLSLQSFIAEAAPFVFVARRADGASDFIRAEAAALGIGDAAVLELEAPTDGQATTAMAAASALDANAPIAIYNIDTFVHPKAMPARAVRGAGWIPCFPAAGDGWSFAAADAEGRVSQVREKTRIAPHATVGFYYFSSFALYADAYERHYADPANLEKDERYVAPLYNRLIADGRDVFIHEVPLAAVIPLGVPAEVERFAAGAAPAL